MTSKKPVIGISVDCTHDPEDARTRGNLTLNWNYAEAIAEAGGVPIIIPPMADPAVVSGLIDGWLIPGGNDIDAANFGELNHEKTELQDPERYKGESALYGAVDPSLPILGICYGCQFLNVRRGGSLIQHIPDLGNVQTHTGGVMQRYEIDGESKLAEIVGRPEASGKSYHHQAIGRVGSALAVSAKGEDGIIEAIEATDRPWLVGVQWHPERTAEDHESKALFTKFVEAARAYSARKSG